MEIKLAESGKVKMISINSPEPAVKFQFSGKSRSISGDRVKTAGGMLRFALKEGRLIIEKELDTRESLVGFGEKAFEINRRRLRMTMWNRDPGGYRRGADPIYCSIPMFISTGSRLCGYFLNSASRSIFDTGMEDYDFLRIEVDDTSAQLFVFEGESIPEILELYTGLTGRPFMPPRWAMGHQVSRYSYFPDSKVREIIEEYLKIAPVSSVYLDIDYMDGYKVFTWDSRRFKDPVKLSDWLHSKGIKVVTIVDPGLKAEQDFEAFLDGMGCYVRTQNNELYLGRVWPGLCAFPDFLSERGHKFWKKRISEFVSRHHIDGIWLDMNEPSIFNEIKGMHEDALHRMNGRDAPHRLVHNAYALAEAAATYEGLKDAGAEPFILSRSGFAGIQKYAALWTGDNESSWDDLRLQISMVCSLGLSGVPFCGCDLGGFMGRTESELLARYYQMAAFFPIYRNHKAKDGSDQELFLLPERYRTMALEAVKMRYFFMDYLYSLAYEAHKKGHPVIRPLFYEFPSDGNCMIDDEYMVGPNLLYAPVLDRGAKSRAVYLPEGSWYEWFSRREVKGKGWIDAQEEMPLFIRKNSVTPTNGGGFIVFGDGKFLLYDGRECAVEMKGRRLNFSRKMEECAVTFIGMDAESLRTDGQAELLSKGGNAVLKGRRLTWVELV